MIFSLFFLHLLLTFAFSYCIFTNIFTIWLIHTNFHLLILWTHWFTERERERERASRRTKTKISTSSKTKILGRRAIRDAKITNCTIQKIQFVNDTKQAKFEKSLCLCTKKNRDNKTFFVFFNASKTSQNTSCKQP